MRVVTLCGALALTATSLFADFSYRETSKITGGAMAAMMKVAGVFSKAAREPIEATVAIKGNRMVHRSNQHASITDLDKRTITEVDLQKKTYSVMTFEEMKQALEAMSRKMQDKKNADAEMNFKVSANATGKRKQIAGFDAQEMLIQMEMQGTDKKSGQSGSMVIYTDVWMADNIPGYGEVRDFYKKMAAELNWAPGGNMFMSQPQVAKGMAEAFKELSKQTGAPVFQTTVMGPQGTPPPSVDPTAPAAAKDSKPKPSAGSVLGGAIGGRFGLGRKKAQEEPQPEQSGQQNQQGGTLLEMQTEYSNFSTTADPALFEVPAGFKQVESEMKKMK